MNRCEGQATLEAMLVLIAFLSIAICLGLLKDSLQTGKIYELVKGSGSHCLGSKLLEGLEDIALY